MPKQFRTSLAAYMNDPDGLVGSAPAFLDLDSFDEIDMDQLRVEFMRMSPSYACVDRATGTSAKNLKQLRQLFSQEDAKTPRKETVDSLKTRFDAIRRAHEEYGCINMPILDWYKERGRYVFDNWANRRDVKFLGITHHSDGLDLSDPMVMDQAVEFLKSIASADDWPKTMLLAVPFDLPKRVAQRHVMTLLDAYYDLVLKIDDVEYRQRKKLATQRERPDALVRKLRAMLCKAFHPDLPLWKIGLIANVSPSHNNRWKAKGITKQEKINMRPEIATLTSRAIRQGQYIAEHAAMDVFPVSEKLSIPTYDWHEVRERVLLSYPNMKVKIPAELAE
jgi:hypothetical protein